MNNQHEGELRRLAMRVALDLSILSRHDARAVLTMADGLVDHFLHPIAGRNEGAMQALEDMATCRRGGVK
jgi:hypothetical protein